MSKRLFVVGLMMVFGMAGVYGAKAARASSEAASAPQMMSAIAPLSTGDKVTLIYAQVSMDRMAPQTECTVIGFQATYVRCELAPNSREGERWANLAMVVEILKHQK